MAAGFAVGEERGEGFGGFGGFGRGFGGRFGGRFRGGAGFGGGGARWGGVGVGVHPVSSVLDAAASPSSLGIHMDVDETEKYGKVATVPGSAGTDIID